MSILKATLLAHGVAAESTLGLPARFTLEDEWYLLRDYPRILSGFTGANGACPKVAGISITITNLGVKESVGHEYLLIKGHVAVGTPSVTVIREAPGSADERNARYRVTSFWWNPRKAGLCCPSCPEQDPFQILRSPFSFFIFFRTESPGFIHNSVSPMKPFRFASPACPFPGSRGFTVGRTRVLDTGFLQHSFDRFPDLTVQAEALFGFIENTISQEMVAEFDFLAIFDSAKGKLRNVVDMPDRKLDLFLRICRDGKGKLSKAKRSLFKEITKEELGRMEKIVKSAIAEL